jgi:hypothetical protein
MCLSSQNRTPSHITSDATKELFMWSTTEEFVCPEWPFWDLQHGQALHRLDETHNARSSSPSSGHSRILAAGCKLSIWQPQRVVPCYEMLVSASEQQP